jgi:membrane protein DedA with SNARE-associated domain
VAAIVGDSVGYYVGERHGHHLLKLPIIRHRRGAIDSALAQLKLRGPLYVFVGRFTAFLRAVMPGLAGMSRMEYKKFLLANAAGGIVWGVGFTLIGYLSGHAIHKVERYMGRFGIVLLVAVVSFMVWHHIHAKRKQQAFEQAYAAQHPDSANEN